jgi:flavorubredoxin
MKWIKKVMVSLLAVVFTWLILTVYVQLAGKPKHYSIENQNAILKAVVVFNPDPFYDLDEEVCVAFAEGLRFEGFSVDVASYDLIDTSLTRYDLVVLCANTYNWSPDWRISSFIWKHNELKEKNCVAITLGSGSTERSKMLHAGKKRYKNHFLIKELLREEKNYALV